jgi:hypothetical protein
MGNITHRWSSHRRLLDAGVLQGVIFPSLLYLP